MKKISFNEGWKCYRTGEPEKAFDVTVPHDAMLLDERSETSASGVNAGWYEVQDYTYEKTFQVPGEYEGHAVTFEFEGVYRKASVYINGKKAAFHDYGYTGFYVKADDFLKYGEENHIRVEAVNSDQPNCRWYSGTGIYRPVWLYVQPKEHLRLGRIRVTTLDYNTPVIKVEAQTNTKGRVKVQILDGDQELAAVTGLADSVMTEEIELPKAELWSPENPKLYTCRAAFGDDVQEISFGIRMVECTPEKGFLLNGERVILKGACIHHDNGILGACAYDFAEERKIRILLENGYNAIRCAHNPCSKALLDACDRMGMLVMDEYTDGWYIHKNKYDYANEIMDNYKSDLKDLVEKDYNHPSVIMYSIGNEVAERNKV